MALGHFICGNLEQIYQGKVIHWLPARDETRCLDILQHLDGSADLQAARIPSFAPQPQPSGLYRIPLWRGQPNAIEFAWRGGKFEDIDYV